MLFCRRQWEHATVRGLERVDSIEYIILNSVVPSCGFSFYSPKNRGAVKEAERGMQGNDSLEWQWSGEEESHLDATLGSRCSVDSGLFSELPLFKHENMRRSGKATRSMAPAKRLHYRRTELHTSVRKAALHLLHIYLTSMERHSQVRWSSRSPAPKYQSLETDFSRFQVLHTRMPLDFMPL